MKRRDFVGGTVCGAVAAVGIGRWRDERTPPPAPPAPAPPPPPALPEHARLSFAQQGEDIVLFHAVRELLAIAAPTYLDIGAGHPVRGSNTYLLYTTGARGVLVEPNPLHTTLARQVRPGDVVVEAGIGVADADAADYYEIKGQPSLNTFSPEQVAHLQRGQRESVVERVVKKPLLGINRVIAERMTRTPDLISTDVEGLDYAIIRTLDLSRFRPAVICAEAAPTTKAGRMSAMTSYLVSRGYVPRGGSMYNTIYLDARRL